MDQKASSKQNVPTVPRSVISVKTDGDAKLPERIKKLKPNTTYMIYKDEYVPPARKMESREEIVEWIDKCVLGDLRTVRLGIEEREKRDKRGGAESSALGGGNFLLAAGCCMTLEYFGQVYGKGTNATESVQKYVEKFLQPIDERYIEFWPILWRSFRNGIIHGSWPQKICMEGSGEQIAIGADNSPDGDHLRPASNHKGKSFVISSPRFFYDIECSFNKNEGFRDWIRNDSDDGVLERAAPRLLEIKKSNKEGKKAFNDILSLKTTT